jgi:WD40 repeat protein
MVRFGHVFMFDTASSVGEIAGHNKAINSVHIKPNRPFRIVTGSDDNTVNFYHGVPYKFEKSIKSHSRFVQAVRFSPSGELFVSAGMDGKLFLYDGKTGDQKAELSTASQSHSGGIFAVSLGLLMANFYCLLPLILLSNCGMFMLNKSLLPSNFGKQVLLLMTNK